MNQNLKNKTDRQKNKKVNCKDCGANLTLKTLRYSHKYVGPFGFIWV